MSYEKLFTPITMRGVTFPNRIQRTSMVSGLTTEEGFVTEDLKKRYLREAKGGVGAIVVEAAVVIPSKSPYNLRISSDEFVPGITGLVKEVREAHRDVRMGIQIMQHLKLCEIRLETEGRGFQDRGAAQDRGGPRCGCRARPCRRLRLY